MTKLVLATLIGLVAGLSAAPEPPAVAPERVAVVVDASDGPAAIAAARRCAAERSAALRLPRTLQEQVSVTAALTARGYRRVYAAGLEAPYATAPLRGRTAVTPLARC